jgi:hypothetical protein
MVDSISNNELEEKGVTITFLKPAMSDISTQPWSSIFRLRNTSVHKLSLMWIKGGKIIDQYKYTVKQFFFKLQMSTVQPPEIELYLLEQLGLVLFSISLRIRLNVMRSLKVRVRRRSNHRRCKSQSPESLWRPKIVHWGYRRNWNWLLWNTEKEP